MKIYNEKNVLEAALDRIRFLFDEFEEVVVGVSGGKDSTVTLHLALQVAKEKNRLPLSVMWIDQEAEWQGTVDHCTEIMTMKDVKPYWFQMPMVITNNASSFNRYSYCWRESDKEKWIHPKHPISIKENKYGTDRFHDLFAAIFKVEFKGKKACYLAGVRAEEAPKRFVALTQPAKYKWITWGKRLHNKWQQFTFYPLYDWSYTDIWHYISSNKIKYNRIYDEMYRHGVKYQEMRISNLHHETAIQSLLIVQEIEPKTWNRLADRIDGANTVKHIEYNSFTCPKELPSMFTDWEEYALYLAKHIVQEDKYRDMLYKKIEETKNIYNDNELIRSTYWRAIVNTILSSDWDFTKLRNWEMSPNVYSYRIFKGGRIEESHIIHANPFFTRQQKKKIAEVIYG